MTSIKSHGVPKTEYAFNRELLLIMKTQIQTILGYLEQHHMQNRSLSPEGGSSHCPLLAHVVRGVVRSDTPDNLVTHDVTVLLALKRIRVSLVLFADIDSPSLKRANN